jgi:hypothetical protein
MAEPASPLLAGWSNFYVMTGSSAAALTGLVFVVITLVSRPERAEDAHAGISTFATPTVMHFAAVLLVSAVLLAPWRSLVHPGVVVSLIGLSGVAYVLRVMHRTTRLTIYTADLEDWAWFSILPLVAYGAMTAGAIALAAAPLQALFIIAGVVVLLIFIGIRNAWDIVTYIAIRGP